MDKEKRSQLSGSPWSVRLPDALRKELKRAAKIMNLTEVQVINLAADIGLEHLARIDYNLARIIVDSKQGKPVGLTAVNGPTIAPTSLPNSMKKRKSS